MAGTGATLPYGPTGVNRATVRIRQPPAENRVTIVANGYTITMNEARLRQ